MLKNGIYLAGLLILAATTTGCQTINAMKKDADAAIAAFNSKIIGEQETVRAYRAAELPAVAEAFVGTLFLRLRGRSADAIATSTGVMNSAVLVPEPSFRYDGFGVESVELFETDAKPEAGTPIKIKGRMQLLDVSGRRAIVGFVGAVTKTADGYRIDKGAWKPMPPARPRFEAFVVDSDALTMPAANSGDYVRTYEFIFSAGQKFSETHVTSKDAGDYAVVVIAKDRLKDGDKYQIALSMVKSGTAGYSAASSYLDFKNGWSMAAIPGQFPLAPEKPFFVKVNYQANGKDPVQVWLYSLPTKTKSGS